MVLGGKPPGRVGRRRSSSNVGAGHHARTGVVVVQGVRRLADSPAMGEYRFTPDEYLESMHSELPDYEELQEATAAATAGLDAREVLELGTGTGETARRVLALHPRARLTGVDESPPMLEEARRTLPSSQVRELRVGRLQDPLPGGPFDLVLSALAIHHLTSAEKRDLFGRVADVLAPGGLFALADVVIPERPGDAITPLEEGYDLPDRVDHQLAWLRDAGLEPAVTWSRKDVAVLAARRL
jgi:tRNA (cmo5U34)-methyltransferase